MEPTAQSIARCKYFLQTSSTIRRSRRVPPGRRRRTLDVVDGRVPGRHPAHLIAGLVPVPEEAPSLQRLDGGRGQRREHAVDGRRTVEDRRRRCTTVTRVQLAPPCRWRGSASSSHSPSSSRALNWAARKRIFDGSCVTCLRTYAAPTAASGIEEHDGLAAEQAVLRAAEREHVDAGVDRERPQRGGRPTERRRGVGDAGAVHVDEHAHAGAPRRRARRSRRRCRPCRARSPG